MGLKSERFGTSSWGSKGEEAIQWRGEKSPSFEKKGGKGWADLEKKPGPCTFQWAIRGGRPTAEWPTGKKPTT